MQREIFCVKGNPFCRYLYFVTVKMTGNDEYFIFYFFIEVLELLCDVVLVSVYSECESAMGVHISLPFWTSLSPQ